MFLDIKWEIKSVILEAGLGGGGGGGRWGGRGREGEENRSCLQAVFWIFM